MRRAKKFIRKINPSAYEPDVDVEQIETVVPRGVSLHGLADNLATLHGRWWHTFFQKMKWRDGLAGADRLFETLHAQAPDRERSAKEWKRVREGLFASETAHRFAEAIAANADAAEFPFSWSIDQNSALEGVIDFLLIEEKQKRALLIDWKTNNISLGDAEVLRVRYRPQLTAYWKATGEITRLEVSAGLFSTALGRFLLYEPDELAVEWKRLEQLPPDQVAEETSIP